MNLLKVLVFFSCVAFSFANNSKKLRRGIKILGQAARPHDNEIADSVCEYKTSSNCFLVGDPHLKSFHDYYDQVSADDSGFLNIYTYDGFKINCTTYSRDLMDNIHWGDEYEWHIDDCKNKQIWLPSKQHVYSDGSIITAKVKCRGAKNKMHINLLLEKTITSVDPMSFDEYEFGIYATGACADRESLIP
jgi:hypothetical protein